MFARHHVSTLNKRHTLVLELIKDSFNVGYPDEEIDLFTNNELDQGEIYGVWQKWTITHNLGIARWRVVDSGSVMRGYITHMRVR